jgi:hypothetical protein
MGQPQIRPALRCKIATALLHSGPSTEAALGPVRRCNHFLIPMLLSSAFHGTRCVRWWNAAVARMENLICDVGSRD